MVSKKTIQEQEAFDRRVHKLICGCSGMTISSIANKFGCGWHTVDRSLRRLEAQGKIRLVEGCKSPRIYENGERSLDPYGTLADEKMASGEDVYMPHITPGESSPQKGKKDKTVRAHITGCFSIDICRNGLIEKAIPDDNGFTIGAWNLTPRKLKASQYYKGYVSLKDEQIKFRAHQSNTGEWTTLSVYPNPRTIYYATATVEAHRVMADQVEIVTKILSKRDWEFKGNPVFKGTMHYGGIAPELLRYAGRSFKEDIDNATLHADHSVPEGELEIYDDPFDRERTQDNINVLYNLPDRLRAMEDGIKEMESAVLGLYRLYKRVIELEEINVKSSKLLTETMTNYGYAQAEQVVARAKTSDEDDRTGYQ